jgi:ABC-2 type transport system permease protein
MMATTAIAIVIVIIVNLIINSVSGNFTQIDLSRKDIFTLTDTSVEYLEKLDKDVTIITLAAAGSEYADLQRLLQDYKAHSSHITLQTKDPAKSPDIVSKYNANLTQGSLVVVCGEKYKTIDLTDMVQTKSIDDDTNYVYYEYDMEGQITNAIDYVTSDKTTKAYVLMGNGKTTLGTIETSIEKQNIDVEEWNIDNDGAIPDDADLLIINSATKDLTDNEYAEITAYLDKGGTMFIGEEYSQIKTGASLPNFDALLERFGMSVQHVTVLEQNDSYYYTDDDNAYNFRVKPVLRKHEITNDLIDDGYSLLLVITDKIDIEEKDNVEVVPLLESSGTAYYKAKDSSTYTKDAVDPAGTYTYVAAATETMEDGTQAKLIYSGASTLLNREIAANLNETLAKGNTLFTVNCMKWLTGQEDTVYVDTKSKSYNRLIYVHDVDVKLGYITVGLPAVILLAGGIVWYKRRKK